MPQSDRYWTIGELVKEFDVTARALRFYEAKGLLAPKREGTVRRYNSRDRVRLNLLLRGKRIGLSLNELKGILDAYDLEGGRRHQLEIALGKFKSQTEILENQKVDLEIVLETLKTFTKRVEELLAASDIDEEAYRIFMGELTNGKLQSASS